MEDIQDPATRDHVVALMARCTVLEAQVAALAAFAAALLDDSARRDVVESKASKLLAPVMQELTPEILASQKLRAFAAHLQAVVTDPQTNRHTG